MCYRGEMRKEPASGVRLDEASWQAGYVAGASGGGEACPPEVPDGLAYAGGLIEGRAARERAKALTRAAEQDGC